LSHIVYIVTEWTAADWHLRGQLAHMRALGHRVTLLTHGPDEGLERISRREGVHVVDVPMSREIAPLADLSALSRLVTLLARLRPDVVHASTPKAGLLGMLAACVLGTPIRIYMLRGLRLETTSGVKRAILWGCERVSMSCAHHVVCVSPSLRERAVGLGLLAPGQGLVLGNGSSNGLDATRFAATPAVVALAASLRGELGIPSGALVLGFVGRMTRDKGIDELLQAFHSLALEWPNLYLLLVGDFEDGDPVSDGARHLCQQHPRIMQTGFVREPEPYYHMMDVLAFPSWREGFPNVPLQGAASCLPVVAFDATGSRDAVLDGSTGALVPLGDVDALAASISTYLAEPDTRRAHGEAGRRWVSEAFEPEVVWQEAARLYEH
jgi:glycosyltransferase involved in cell wall biosynthesis